VRMTLGLLCKRPACSKKHETKAPNSLVGPRTAMLSRSVTVEPSCLNGIEVCVESLSQRRRAMM
jgi:hypothetical protein